MVPIREQKWDQIFDFAGTFGEVALQQILDTMCRDNPRNHTVRDLIMRFDRIGTALFVSAFFAATPAMAQTPYDGLWSVKVVTKTGSCEPETRSTLTITDGKISAAGADVTGRLFGSVHTRSLPGSEGEGLCATPMLGAPASNIVSAVKKPRGRRVSILDYMRAERRRHKMARGRRMVRKHTGLPRARSIDAPWPASARGPGVPPGLAG